MFALYYYNFNLKSLSYASNSELELLQQQVRASEWLQFEKLHLQEVISETTTSPSPVSPPPPASLNCSAACSALPLPQDLHEEALNLPEDGEEEENQEGDLEEEEDNAGNKEGKVDEEHEEAIGENALGNFSLFPKNGHWAYL